MAVIRKKLGNSRRIIDKRFREHFPDGLGGLRFDAFCCGWKESWAECTKQLQAESAELHRITERLGIEKEELQQDKARLQAENKRLKERISGYKRQAKYLESWYMENENGEEVK